MDDSDDDDDGILVVGVGVEEQVSGISIYTYTR